MMSIAPERQNVQFPGSGTSRGPRNQGRRETRLLTAPSRARRARGSKFRICTSREFVSTRSSVAVGCHPSAAWPRALAPRLTEGRHELPRTVAVPTSSVGDSRRRARLPSLRPERAAHIELSVVAQIESHGRTDGRRPCSRSARSQPEIPTLASVPAVIRAALSSRLYPHGQALSRPQRRPGHPVGPIGDHLDLGEAVKQRREDNLALHPG